MDPLTVYEVIGAIVASAVGGTWVLRSALGRVETAIKVHVAEDRVVHKNHELRIVHLEKARHDRR